MVIISTCILIRNSFWYLAASHGNTLSKVCKKLRYSLRYPAKKQFHRKYPTREKKKMKKKNRPYVKNMSKNSQRFGNQQDLFIDSSKRQCQKEYFRIMKSCLHGIISDRCWPPLQPAPFVVQLLKFLRRASQRFLHQNGRLASHPHATQRAPGPTRKPPPSHP